MRISRPQPEERGDWFARYIATVPDDVDFVRYLLEQLQTIELRLGRLSEEKLTFRYEPGKWTIRDILSHLIDGERVFSYRALRFARNDQTELPGFDESEYAAHSNAARRSVGDLLAEFRAVRLSTIELIKSLDEPMMTRSGVASGQRVTVRSLIYIIAGHVNHHLRIIDERYLR